MNLEDSLKKFNIVLVLLSASIFTLTAHAGLGRNDDFKPSPQHYRDLELRAKEIRIQIWNHNVDVLSTFVSNYKNRVYPNMEYAVMSAIYDTIIELQGHEVYLNLSTILDNIINSDGSLK